MLNHNPVSAMPQNKLAGEQDLTSKISNTINKRTLSIPCQEWNSERIINSNAAVTDKHVVEGGAAGANAPGPRKLCPLHLWPKK